MKKSKNPFQKTIFSLLTIAMFFGLVSIGHFGNVAKATDPVALSGEKAYFNFTRSGYPENSSLDLKDSSYTTFPATGARPWAYVSSTVSGTPGSSGTNTTLLKDNLQIQAANLNERIVLKVKLPTMGRYRVKMKYLSYLYAGTIDTYLIPKTADAVANVGNYMTSQYKLGSINAYSTTTSVKTGSLNDAVVDYTADDGNYLLVFCLSGKTKFDGTNMIIQGITFDGRTPLELSGAAVANNFSLGAYGDSSTADAREAVYRDYGSGSRPWAYVSDTVTGTTPVKFISQFLQVASQQNQYVVFKVKVPSAGRYKATFSANCYNNGGIIDVYLVPYSQEAVTNISNYLTDNYLLDWADTYQASGQTVKDFSFDDALFTATESLLVFKCSRHTTTSSYYMVISKLSLDGRYLASADLSLDKTEIDFGGTATATASGKMSDGTDSAGTTLSYSSSNPSIATIDPSTGVITGVSAGRVRITVTATLNGVTVTNNKNVLVGHSNAAAQGALRISVSNTTGTVLSDVAITGDESTPAFTLNEQGSFNTGTSFTVTAPTVSGKTFLYWKNATSKRVVTTSQTCTFKIGSNSYLTAVYKETGSGVMVEFVDKNGKVLQSTFLNETTTSVNAPTPYSIGYDFQSWTSGSLNINGGSEVSSPLIGAKDTRFLAQYSKAASQYSVTVTGSTTDGTTSHAYDELISVTASVPADKEFAYWTRNGQIISCSPTYSFYVWDNATVAAVYVATGEALPPIPQVMMDLVKTAAGRVIFSAERSVSDGYELVESGILMTSDSAIATNAAFNLQTTGIIKAVTQSGNNNGQFTVRRDNVSGTWYARAYLIYKDIATGLCKVVYSNIVNGTAQ